mgnify:FL=1
MKIIEYRSQDDNGLNMSMYFSIVETNGSYRLNGYFDNDIVYSTADDARLAANQCYAKELITLVPEFNIQDVKPLDWDCPIYTELDATLEIESCEQGYKVIGRLRVYISFTPTIVDSIDSVSQGEAPYASIDEVLIAAKRFMRQLVVNNLIQPIK